MTPTVTARVHATLEEIMRTYQRGTLRWVKSVRPDLDAKLESAEAFVNQAARAWRADIPSTDVALGEALGELRAAYIECIDAYRKSREVRP